MTRYERIVAAALKAKGSNMALAESLALDIPKDAGEVMMQLAEAAEEITQAGGDEYATKTLGAMRTTALWVRRTTDGAFEWREGSSLTAHRLMSATTDADVREWFYKLPRTANEVSAKLGNVTTGNNVAEMSTSQQVDTLDDLIAADPDLVIERVAKAKAKEAIAKHEADGKGKAKAKPDTKAVQIGQLVSELTRQARQWGRFFGKRWERMSQENWEAMSAVERKEVTDSLLTIRGCVDAILDGISETATK